MGRQQILVASDEANALYLFNSQGGDLQKSYSLEEFLPNRAEMDIEAGVLHDGGVWWIGSHGLDANADTAPNRNVLFKIGLPDVDNRGNGKVELLSELYDLSELIQNSVDDSARKLAPKKGGINVEGMSFTINGDLLVALRSPLSNGTSGSATIIQLALKNNEFKVVDTFQLALGNRGIRDLVITDNGYLLIAGGVASGGRFTVYRWNLAGQPVELFEVPEGFNAEALVDMGQEWLLLSDDGKVARVDNDAEDGYRDCEDIETTGGARSNVYFRGLRFVP